MRLRRASSKLFLNTVCPSKGRRRITKIKKTKEKKRENPTTIYTRPTLPLYRAYTYMVIIICQKIISTLVCTTDRRRQQAAARPFSSGRVARVGRRQKRRDTVNKRDLSQTHTRIIILKYRTGDAFYFGIALYQLNKKVENENEPRCNNIFFEVSLKNKG